MGTLPELFQRVFQQTVKIQDTTQEVRDDLRMECRSLASEVEKLNLFSVNEEVDDIHTNDLKYLLVPALLGRILTECTDMERRYDHLKQSIVAYQVFLSRARRFKFAPEEEDNITDAGKLRMRKIERLKFSKTLDAKIVYLLERKKELCGEEYNWGTAGALDEEKERELIISLTQRTAIEAIDNIASAESELPLLEMRRGIQEGLIPAPKKEEPMKPWIVSIKDPTELRRMYMEQVFQPDILMPTISIADAADFELEQALELAEKQNRPKPVLTEEEEDMKKRNWDDWKDDNPKGWGNKQTNIS